jgi:hypothetical protein
MRKAPIGFPSDQGFFVWMYSLSQQHILQIFLLEIPA